jgi:hypothetical protein
VLLISGVGDGRIGGCDFDSDSGADEVVDRRYRGAEEDDWKVGVREGKTDLVGEAEADGKGGCLRGLPGEDATRRGGLVRWFE